MPDAWITFAEAVRIVTETRGASVGRAEAVVRAARKSGEVRPAQEIPLLVADDGVVGLNLRREAAVRFSRDDFVDWLDRNFAIKQQVSTASNRNSGHKTELARKAAQEIWGESGPPRDLPPQQVFKQVADKVGKLHPGVSVGKSQVLRALGLK